MNDDTADSLLGHSIILLLLMLLCTGKNNQILMPIRQLVVPGV